MKSLLYLYILLFLVSCKSNSDVQNSNSNNIKQEETIYELDLINTFLTELPDSIIGKQYSSINLGGNNSFTDVSVLLDYQKNLKYFGADFNELQTWPLGEIHRGIEQISLQANLLDSIPASLCSYSSLTELHLKENKFVRLPECLWSLPSLKNVNISFNYITSIKPTNASGAIEILDLQSNELTEVSSELFKLPKLRYLNLADNKLKTIPLDTLPPQLEKLVLTGNPISEKERNRIIQKLNPERTFIEF